MTKVTLLDMMCGVYKLIAYYSESGRLLRQIILADTRVTNMSSTNRHRHQFACNFTVLYGLLTYPPPPFPNTYTPKRAEREREREREKERESKFTRTVV